VCTATRLSTAVSDSLSARRSTTYRLIPLTTVQSVGTHLAPFCGLLRVLLCFSEAGLEARVFPIAASLQLDPISIEILKAHSSLTLLDSIVDS
jgi:hypothetical protein